MSILILAEHNNEELKPSTLSTINAAHKINSTIDVIVIGAGCDNVINKLSKVQSVNKILVVDDDKYKNHIAENFSKIILSCVENYTHVLAPASTFG